ncbi:MAG: hypothetical protein ACRD12_24515 [Acidimicrobiales bacterium]
MLPDRRGLLRANAPAAFAVFAVLLLAPVVFPSAASAADVDLAVRIDGVPIERTSNSVPLILRPQRSVEMVVTVTNGGPSPIDVRTVRLEGTVIGLTFFRYDTSVAARVAPGQTESRHILLDLRGLQKQATGLMAGSVSVLDDDRNRIAGEDLVVDVKGSIWSLYGLFGLMMVVLTGAAVLGVLLALARGRLPRNRWMRAMRFAPIGIGFGLVVIFTLSVFRIWAPNGPGVLGVLGVLTAVAFVAGYLTPTPDEPEPDRESLEMLLPEGAAPPNQGVS